MSIVSPISGALDVLLVFRVLLELQTNDDPVWMYFDNHHKHILSQMNTSYRSSVATIEGIPELGVNSHLSIVDLPEVSNLPQDIRQYHGSRRFGVISPGATANGVCKFRNQTIRSRHRSVIPLLVVPKYTVDNRFPFLIAKSADEPIWQAIHDMVKNISEVMMSSLPSFWRISKDFMEGKFKKVRYNVCS